MPQLRMTRSPSMRPLPGARCAPRAASMQSTPVPSHPILQLQRTVGNHAVASLVQARLAASHAGHSHDGEAGLLAQRDAAPAGVKSATPEVLPPTDATKPGVAPERKSTLLNVRAEYEAIPGVSKAGPKAALADSALWFDPLTIASTSPSVDETTDRIGVTKGRGQLIASQRVPLHEDSEAGAGEGTGTLTAQLKYTEHLQSSYSVRVQGDFKNKGDDKKADAALKAYVGRELAALGDIESVESRGVEVLRTQFPDATNLVATITPNEKNRSLQDAGKTHVYYKARNKPTIQLKVPIVAVADRVITSGGTTSKQNGSDVSTEAHGNIKTDVVKVDDTKTDKGAHSEGAVQTNSEVYHAENKRTYQEIITLIQSKVESISRILVTKADANSDYTEKGDWVAHDEYFKFDDYTKNVKAGSKEGDKDEKNWAAYLEDALGGVSEVIDIPLVKVLPGGVGKFLRKLNEFGVAINLAKRAAGEFAVRGKVHYRDTHDDTEAHDKQHGTDDAHGNSNRTVTRKDTSSASESLKGTMTSVLSSVQNRFGTDNTTTDVTKSGTSTQVSGGSHSNVNTDNYQKTGTQADIGGSVTARTNQVVRTEMSWSQSVRETTTRPVLEATVVDGDGEVSATAFGAPSPFNAPPKTNK